MLERILRIQSSWTRRTLLKGGGALSLAAVSQLPFSASANADDTPVMGGRLRVGYVGGGSTERVFPFKTPSYIETARNINVWEPLVRTARPLSKIEYRLAESIEPNKTKDVWQLKLRSGTTFHNGKTVTADDVLYTWSYILNPENKATARKLLETLIDLPNTKKVSDAELSIALKHSVADLPRILATGIWHHSGIVPDGTTNFEGPVGAGAFKLASFAPGQVSVLTRNDDYFDEKAYLDEVEMLTIADSNARFSALVAGQVDAAEFVDFPLAKANETNPAIKILRTEADQTVPFTMRVDAKPFEDPRVRLAFKLAVDREKLIEVALLGYGRVGNDLFGPSFPSYNSAIPQRSYDPERAKALLKEAGYDTVDVTLFTSTAVTGMLESATVFAEQAKASGINVELVKLPADDYWNVESHYLKAPFYQSNYYNSFEGVTRSALLPGSSWSETKWEITNPGWGKQFLEAEATVDPAKQKTLFDALQQELWESGGYIVWGFQDLVDAISPRLKGLEPYPPYPLGAYQFSRAWLSA